MVAGANGSVGCMAGWVGKYWLLYVGLGNIGMGLSEDGIDANGRVIGPIHPLTFLDPIIAAIVPEKEKAPQSTNGDFFFTDAKWDEARHAANNAGQLQQWFDVIHQATPPISSTPGFTTITTNVAKIPFIANNNQWHQYLPPTIGPADILPLHRASQAWDAFRENQPKQEFLTAVTEKAQIASDWKNLPWEAYDTAYDTVQDWYIPIEGMRQSLVEKRDMLLEDEIDKERALYRPIIAKNEKLQQVVGNFKDDRREEMNEMLRPVHTAMDKMGVAIPTAGALLKWLPSELLICAIDPAYCDLAKPRPPYEPTFSQ